MTAFTDQTQAALALTDPATSALDLMTIAQTYPALWIGVARHPNTYPDLLTWLDRVGDPAVRQTVATRLAAASAAPVAPAEPAEPAAPAARAAQEDVVPAAVPESGGARRSGSEDEQEADAATSGDTDTTDIAVEPPEQPAATETTLIIDHANDAGTPQAERGETEPEHGETEPETVPADETAPETATRADESAASPEAPAASPEAPVSPFQVFQPQPEDATAYATSPDVAPYAAAPVADTPPSHAAPELEPEPAAPEPDYGIAPTEASAPSEIGYSAAAPAFAAPADGTAPVDASDQNAPQGTTPSFTDDGPRIDVRTGASFPPGVGVNPNAAWAQEPYDAGAQAAAQAARGARNLMILGVVLIVVGIVVFVVCTLVQHAGGGSMFSSTYRPPSAFWATGTGSTLMDITWWPGWVISVACVIYGLVSVIRSLNNR